MKLYKNAIQRKIITLWNQDFIYMDTYMDVSGERRIDW
jgi:hypothetical protein